MTAFILVLLAQAPLERVGSCYRSGDQTAGWKHVTVPADSPALAAPPELDQFRTGQSVLVISDQQVFAYSHRKPRWGVVELTFDLHPDTRLLHVRLAQRLDGMRVEVRGGDGMGRMIPLLPERRHSSDELKLEWNAAGVRQVTVVFHHHVRASPVVAAWSAGHWEAMPAAAQQRLSYLHPGGRVVELCEAPHQRLQARASALIGVTP